MLEITLAELQVLDTSAARVNDPALYAIAQAGASAIQKLIDTDALTDRKIGYHRNMFSYLAEITDGECMTVSIHTAQTLAALANRQPGLFSYVGIVNVFEPAGYDLDQIGMCTHAALITCDEVATGSEEVTEPQYRWCLYSPANLDSSLSDSPGTVAPNMYNRLSSVVSSHTQDALMAAACQLDPRYFNRDKLLEIDTYFWDGSCAVEQNLKLNRYIAPVYS